MTGDPRVVRVTPGSEIARLLARAAKGPLLLEKDGEFYRLDRMGNERDSIWAGYDPEKARQAIAATAGSWGDLDTDALIADLYQAREDGSRPASRP